MAALMNPQRATLDDLLKVKEKAELIDGSIVRFKASGVLPCRVAGYILRDLPTFAEINLPGYVFSGSLGYAIDELPSGRESFSPDISFYDGPLPENLMRFIEGAPTFAVEVRSEGDYSPAAEREMTAKRADYFAAGTKAVWDVDPIQRLIRLYVDDAELPMATFRVGDQAHAESAVPGWKLDVGKVFR